MNNRWAAALALVLALAVPAAAYAAKPEPAAGQQMITMRLNGKIVIDPQGHVREYRIDTQAPKEVQELLGKAIPTWRFHPVEVDGKAVPAQSPMRVVLTAVRHGEGYMLSIDNVLFRPNTELEYAEELAARDPDQIRFTVQDMRPPAYPADLMRAGIDGIVLLVLRLDAEGRMADAMVSQSSLFNAVGGGSALDRARAQLERSALAATAKWRFKVEALPAPTATASAYTVRIPIEYQVSTPDRSDVPLLGTWRHEYRGPARPVPWLVGEQAAEVVGASDLANGEMLSGAPTLRLLNRAQALGAP